MKILIKAYLNGNLGDDLFIKIITERYKHVSFSIKNMSNIDYNHTFPKNISIESGIIQKILNKGTKKISFLKSIENQHIEKKYKATVILGGSLFMEQSGEIQTSQYLRKDNSVYILGSNFGPFKTDKYLTTYKNVFSKAKDICFRETYSKSLFNDLPNVRMASDVIFSLDTSSIKIKTDKRVIFSIINCDIKGSPSLKEIYINKTIELCTFFLQKGYQILLMSFCKNEGDETAIQEIIENMDTETASHIDTHFYSGNMTETLDILANCQIIVGSRFHSNILGMLLNKTVIPIAYSDKMTNVLVDMNFKGKFIDLNKIESLDINSLSDDHLLYKHDVTHEIKNANNHFEKLDILLLDKTE